jgi:hypothetical protein
MGGWLVPWMRVRMETTTATSTPWSTPSRSTPASATTATRTVVMPASWPRAAPAVDGRLGQAAGLVVITPGG